MPAFVASHFITDEIYGTFHLRYAKSGTYVKNSRNVTWGYIKELFKVRKAQTSDDINLENLFLFENLQDLFYLTLKIRNLMNVCIQFPSLIEVIPQSAAFYVIRVKPTQ